MKEGEVKKDYTIPALFTTAVVLVFVFLTVSLIFGNKKYPSVEDGASTLEVKNYAYSLLEKDNGTNNFGYNDAIIYYTSQISSSKNREQKFNLMIDLATFYGKTGDPHAGIQVLNEVDNAIPLNAKYFLYTAYMYLYSRLGDEAMVANYRQKITDEKIDEYFAGIKDGSITPVSYDSYKSDGNNSDDEHDQIYYEEDQEGTISSPTNPFNTEGL